MDFEDQLSSALRTSVEPLRPPVTDLVAGGLARGRQRQRRRNVGRVAVAAATVVALAGVGVAVVRDGSPDSTTTAGAGPDCRSVVSNAVLPVWARAGFSDATPTIDHVFSARRDLVAILFVPLHAPPAATQSNKILWVARVASDVPAPLVIDAVRAGTTTHVRREVPGGPGPSSVDLPQAGCWHLELRWGAHRDSMDLVYVKP
jgi:hypothetical protein